MNKRGIVAGFATLVVALGLEGVNPVVAGSRKEGGAPARTPPGAGSSAPEETPAGGRNLKWCLRGVRLYSAGVATSDLLEVSGAVLMFFNCR
jgi:hypothetical protein